MNKPILLSNARLFVLVVFFLLVGGINSYSWGIPHQLSLTVGYDVIIPGIPGQDKNPVLVPQAWLDDHEITFTGMHPAFTLLLIEDDVVFSLDLPSTASSVILPLWLSGEYQIVLRPNGCNYYF